MSTFLKDSKSGVCLRPIEVEDAELCIKWMNDQRNRQMLRVWLPYSLEKERGWIKKIAEQATPPADVPLLITWKGKPVGVAGLHRIQWDWRCAEIGICIGERKKRHSGVGSASYRLLMRYAFEEMGLLLLEADVYTTNKPSLKFHQSLGFKRVGYSEPKALVAGKRVPVAIYSMTRGRWRKLHAKK